MGFRIDGNKLISYTGSDSSVVVPSNVSEEIKQAFEDLYEAMNGKTLREKDEVIYAACRLCRSHQQTGFVDGIKLGLYLSQELNN